MVVLSHVQLYVTPWTVARQAPLSMGFSRQEQWSGLPCPPPGGLPDPGEGKTITLTTDCAPFLLCFYFTYHWQRNRTWQTKQNHDPGLLWANCEESRVGKQVSRGSATLTDGLFSGKSVAVLLKRECRLWFISISFHFSMNQNHFHFIEFWW